MELMRSKERYVHLDIPDSDDVTKGPPSKMNSKDKYKRERASQVNDHMNYSSETTLTPAILLPNQVKEDHRSTTYSDHDSE